MIVLVTGGRDYTDAESLESALSTLSPSIIMHGAARGADRIADAWARRHRVTVKAFPANWAEEGPSAGPRRNAAMLAASQPDIVLAAPGGRGTADMVRRATRAGVEVRHVTPTGLDALLG